jgi:hypothetical protein
MNLTVFLPQPPKCWNYKHVLLFPQLNKFLLGKYLGLELLNHNIYIMLQFFRNYQIIFQPDTILYSHQ